MAKTSIPWPVYPTGVPGWWIQEPADNVVKAPAKTSIPWPVYPTGVPGWWMQESESTSASFDDVMCDEHVCTLRYKDWADSMRLFNDTFNTEPSCRRLAKHRYCNFELPGFQVLCRENIENCEFLDTTTGNITHMYCDGPDFYYCDFTYPDRHGETLACRNSDSSDTIDQCKFTLTTSGGSALVKGILQNPGYWLTVVVLAVSAL